MTKTPHKHAEVIKLWADGEAIEYRANDGEKWTECENPAFVDDYYYRVKPARSYPVTALTPKELDQAWGEIFRKMRSVSCDYPDFANFILRHAIDNGQVVTREEFERLTKEHMRATRTLDLAGYADNGGELWKPPPGNGYAERCARDLAVAKAVRHTCYTSSQQAIGRLDLNEIIDKVPNV